MKLVGSLALAALMTMVRGSINATTSAVSCANTHGRDDSITWSTSSAGGAHTQNALDADLPKYHNSSTTLTMSQSWRTLIYNATSVHHTKTITLGPPGETTTASRSSNTLGFTTTAEVHNSTINFGPPTTRSTVTSVSFSTLTGSEDVHFTVIGDQPDEATSSLPAREHDGGELTPSTQCISTSYNPSWFSTPTLSGSTRPAATNGTGALPSKTTLATATATVTVTATATVTVLMEAISQGFESVARLEENQIKARQHYRKVVTMIELVQQAGEKFATIDLETAEQLQHLARQKERKEEVMKEAQDALDVMDGDVFHCLSTILQDNFGAQQQDSQQPTPSEAHLPKEDQHSSTVDPDLIAKRGLSQASVELGTNPLTPQKGKLPLFCDFDLTSTVVSNLCLYIATPTGTKRPAPENSPEEAPATHDTWSTGDIDAEIPSRLSHRVRRVRTTSPSSNEFSSFHASPKRPNMSPMEPTEASTETMQTQRQNPGELGDTPSSSARTRGSGRPRISYNVASFYRELGL
ncbi:hypothetical protein DL770_006873 [Monosporascus sp. CRB-9-2]|nr:hypothetical protein DL770_006873 [Monosporascus sp. CRB-9-2]